MVTEDQPRHLRGTFLQAGDGTWFWAPQPTSAPKPPPAPVEGQLLRPLGQDVVYGFDGTPDGPIVIVNRPSRWVDAHTGLQARGEPR